MATANYKGNNKIGTVGKPSEDTEVKIKDGEILLKGKHVMKGIIKTLRQRMKLLLTVGYILEMLARLTPMDIYL